MSNNHNFLSNFRIIIASLPNKENCVCEIYYNNIQWVEISQESEEPRIQFYSNPNQDYWEFPLDIALETLEKAKKKFIGL